MTKETIEGRAFKAPGGLNIYVDRYVGQTHQGDTDRNVVAWYLDGKDTTLLQICAPEVINIDDAGLITLGGSVPIKTIDIFNAPVMERIQARSIYHHIKRAEQMARLSPSGELTPWSETFEQGEGI